MLKALGMEPAEVAADAEALLSTASGMSEADLLASADFKKVAELERFKYTYTFGAGIIKLMKTVGVEPGPEAIEKWLGEINMSSNTLKRDYEYYQVATEKMAQAKEMMMQMQVSAKKAEAKRLAEKAEKAAEEANAAEEAAGSEKEVATTAD